MTAGQLSQTDPWQPEQRLAIVRLRNRGLATSAATFQHLQYNGKVLGHILDPRTGHPAEGMAAATAIAPNAAVADALATAFFILKSKVWPRITAGLDERDRKIRAEIEAAEEAREKAAKALTETHTRVMPRLERMAVITHNLLNPSGQKATSFGHVRRAAAAPSVAGR